MEMSSFSVMIKPLLTHVGYFLHAIPALSFLSSGNLFAGECQGCQVCCQHWNASFLTSASTGGGAVTEIKSMLGSTTTIRGYLWIENCDSLTSLDGLSKLRVIEGRPEHGLRIRQNDILEDLKPLENLENVVKGGVQILLNKNLCYADLMGVFLNIYLASFSLQLP